MGGQPAVPDRAQDLHYSELGGPRTGAAVLQVHSRGFCGINRTRRHRSGALHGPESLGRVNGPGSAVQSRNPAADPRLLRPGLRETSAEDATRIDERVSPSTRSILVFDVPELFGCARRLGLFCPGFALKVPVRFPKS